MINSDNALKNYWDMLIALLAVGIGILIPLYIVYPAAVPFVPMLSLFMAIACTLDIAIELQTVYQVSGTPITALRERAVRYFQGGMIPDVLAAVPILFLDAAGAIPATCPRPCIFFRS